MKLKKIVVASAKAAFGIRMVKDTGAETCTPKIKGLFLQDDELEWVSTEKIIPQTAIEYPSFIPIRLMGDTCGQDVTWRTEYIDEPFGEGGSRPIFFGEGPLGIVGLAVDLWGWGEVFEQYRGGVLYVWASCAGRQYGPVRVDFTIEFGSGTR
jgi:hypothetical protein